MTDSPRLLRWQLFRQMPLHMQFVTGLILLFGAAMTVLAGLAASAGGAGAVGPLLLALISLAFGLVVIPTTLGSNYT